MLSALDSSAKALLGALSQGHCDCLGKILISHSTFLQNTYDSL